MKRGPKSKPQQSAQEALLEQEIRATADLIAKHTALTTLEQQAIYPYLRKLARVAAAMTVLPASERDAITALCNEVLMLAEGEAVVSYADALRAKVRAIALGEQVWRARYPELDAGM